METTSPGLCRGGDGRTGCGDHSRQTGMNGFRWSYGQAERELQESWRYKEKREIFRLKHDGKG